MGKVLTKAQIELFSEQGFVSPIDVLNVINDLNQVAGKARG